MLAIETFAPSPENLDPPLRGIKVLPVATWKDFKGMMNFLGPVEGQGETCRQVEVSRCNPITYRDSINHDLDGLDSVTDLDGPKLAINSFAN